MRPQLFLALAEAAGTSLRALLRIGRQLFHETTGALFFVLAAFGAVAAWHAWRAGQATWQIALALGFTLMMASFAVGSFRSARRVR